MTQISSYHEAPYQGISQAPPQVRRTDQAEALEDYIVAIPEGAQKRPPFQYVGTLAGHNGASDGVFHRIERTAGDAILAMFNVGGSHQTKIYDLATLVAQAVTINGASQGYVDALSSAFTLQHGIGVNTVADYTFVWQREDPVINDPAAVVANRPYEALIWLRGGAYGKVYTIGVFSEPGGAFLGSISLRTPDGTTTPDANWVDTEVMMASLAAGSGYTSIDGAYLSGALVGTGGLVTGLGPDFVVYGGGGGGSVLYISNNVTDFQVQVTDGQGGIAMVAIKDTVQKFSDLPQKGLVDGFTVRLIQQSGVDTDDMFVQWSTTAGSGTGVWRECLAPGAKLGLNPNTMPHGIVYDGGWQFKPLLWKQRTTGNEELVRDPDFIGKAVQDVCFWQGRLGIVSGEGVTLSCADNPFQLYPRTLATVLDSDPIGRVNPAPGETTFRYAVPFEHRLVLVGDTIQAEVTDGGALTPAKAGIDIMTQHEVSRFIRPSAVNGKLYYATPKGSKASSITEIAVDRITNNPVGDDLSTAAFRYLPANIDRSAVCPTLYTAIYGVSGSADLYLHLFRYDNQERIQNAFERWHLPAGYALGGMFFLNTTLYVLACQGGAGHVLKMDLSPLVLDADTTSTIQTFLDLKASEAQVTGLAYNATTARTTLTLPYPRSDASTAMVVRAPGSAGYPEGYVVPVDAAASTAAGANKLVVVGNLTTTPFYVGNKYTSRWKLSRIYPKDAKGKPLRNGRCNLRRIALDLANTGYIRAEVNAGGRPTRRHEFFGFRWDDPDAHFDQAPNATVRWEFPVMCENEQVDIDLVNDSPFGHSILGYEWLGEFNPKSQRV